MPPQDRFSAGLDRQSPSARASGAEDVGFDRSTGQFNAFAGESGDLGRIARAIAETEERLAEEELFPNALDRFFSRRARDVTGFFGAEFPAGPGPGGDPQLNPTLNALKFPGKVLGMGNPLIDPVALGGKLAGAGSSLVGDIALDPITLEDINRASEARTAKLRAGPTGDAQGEDAPAPDAAADRTAVREARPDLTQLALAMILARRRGGIA